MTKEIDVYALTPPPRPAAFHPLQAILLGFPLPLFVGTLLSDLAYWRTAQIQWANFAQWLNAAGLLAAGLAMLALLVALIRDRGTARGRAALIGGLIWLPAWGTGLMNALVHARDAWGAMPDALWWSAVSVLLALLATWAGYGGFTSPEAP